MDPKVLLVEDDREVQLFIVTALQRNGFTPLTAEDGLEGMRILRERMPDLVILDVLLPKQSGIKMYREMKTDETLKTIPVVICSGISKRTFLRSQEVLYEFKDQQVPVPEAYLEKPVEADELVATLRKFLA